MFGFKKDKVQERLSKVKKDLDGPSLLKGQTEQEEEEEYQCIDTLKNKCDQLQASETCQDAAKELAYSRTPDGIHQTNGLCRGSCQDWAYAKASKQCK